ncbi:MAG: iron ABC transporter permease [Candidatus Methanomethylophilaceae archaeon]|nr:iron ABC transporter permease [Candidatus Methanomethylophilaceae archaeon]
MALEIQAADSDEAISRYRGQILRKIFIIAAGFVLLFLITAAAVTIGTHEITLSEAIDIIVNKILGKEYETGSPEWWDSYLVWEERMPRVFAAMFAGAGLAVAGVAMQSILRNPLADPYTTGISSGAMVGISAAIVLGITIPMFTDELGLMMNAFITGLIPALVIVGVTKMKNSSAATIILAGLAMSFMFGAITQMIMMGAEAEKSQETYKWMVGTLNYVVSDKIPLMAIITLAGTGFFLFVSKQLNLVSLGDTNAKSLGLNAESFRNLCLLVMSIMIAEQVSVTGVLGFVGLVVPHMMRMVVGPDNRYLIPASMVFGAIFVIGSDIIARTVLEGISVGVVVAAIGGPLFLAFIIRKRKEIW